MKSDEQDQVTKVLAEALSEDPGWSCICPDPDTRLTVLRILCNEAITLSNAADGETWVATVNDEIVGSLIWNPPDEDASIPTSTYVGALMRALPEVIKHPKIAIRCVRNLVAVDSLKPKDKVYYAVFLGCSLRGRGIGGRLMGKLAEQCTDYPLYLETQNPGNIGFYERLGFQRHGTLENTYPGGPSCYGFLFGGNRQASQIEFAAKGTAPDLRVLRN